MLSNNQKLFILLPIFLTVFFISTYKLTESPRIWYDDGLFMQVARNVAHYNIFGVQSAPGELDRSIASYVTTGPSITYPLGLVFKFFGVGLLEARIPMVIFLILLVAVSFWLAHRLFGYKTAIISVLMLISFAPLYGNGKLVLGENPGLLFLIVSLLTLDILEKGSSKKKLMSLIFGLSVGLTMITKPIFLLFLPAVLLTILWHRKHANSYLKITWAFVPALFMVGIFYLTYFGEDSVATILAFYGNNYSASLGDMAASLARNIFKFFKESTPAYFFITILAWLGFCWLRKKSGDKIGAAERAALAFSLLIGLAFLKTPGWYRYFYPAHILALLFVPAAVFNIWKYFNHKLFKNRLPAYLIYICFVAMITFQFYQIGFSSWVANDYHSTRSKELAAYFDNFDPGKSIFVYEAAEVVTFLPSDNYYQFFHITGDRYLGDRQPLIVGVPDEIIISSKSMTVGREYLGAYKLKTKLYRGLYLVFEKKQNN